jgi:hypothetical protein
MFINEIESKHVDRLSPDELTEILRDLLHLEAIQCKMDNYQIYVPDKITRADGGEDGGITCRKINGSIWINNKNIIFQNKAKNLTPSECENEFFEIVKIKGKKGPKSKKGNSRRIFKKQIDKVLKAGGKYILFMGYHPGSKQDLDLRIDAFIKACKKSGRIFKRKQFDVYDSRKIADWVNNFLPIIIKVQSFNGISRPIGLITLKELSEYKFIRENIFYTNSILESNIKQIQNAIVNPKTCIRVLGFSGIGKTRLIYETLRDLKDASKSVVYYSVDTMNDRFLDFIKSQKNNMQAILVVDDCNQELFEKISKEISSENCSWSLIGIDFDINDIAELRRNNTADFLVYIDNNEMQDVVTKIISYVYLNKLTASQLDYIAHLADGLPSMAIRLADAQLDGSLETSDLMDDILQKKILFGREYGKLSNSNDYLTVIKACAVFTEFGFPFDDLIKLYGIVEYDKLKGQSYFILNEICKPAVHDSVFMNACQYFFEKGVLERRGRYYLVKPHPLAIQLATDWWRTLFDKDKITVLFPAIVNSGLSVAFVERFKYLDKFDSSKRIANIIFGVESPFASAEVINTELGSRLFRSAVEVNPEATVATLSKLFLDQPKEDLLQIIAGRRNLIWALEKLCFRKESFSIAAKVLYSFAVSENESWGNNATGQFLQLFHTLLPGTEVGFNSRLEIVEWGISKNDIDYIKIAIDALLGAFSYRGAVRSGGAEKQGSGIPLKDYKPEPLDVIDYWNKILDILINLWVAYPNFRDVIQNNMAKSFRQIIEFGALDIVKKLIDYLKVKDVPIPFEFVHNLNLTLKFSKLPNDYIVRINKILSDITPKDIPGKLLSICIKAEWDSEKDDNGKYFDRAKEKAHKLAEEFIKEKVDLEQYLMPLLMGSQMKTTDFAEKYGELLTDKTYKLKLLEIIFNLMGTIPLEIQNSSFLVGYLKSFPQEKRLTIITALLRDSELFRLSVILARFYLESVNDILPFFELVDSNRLTILDLGQLIYGNYTYQLPLTDLIPILNKFWEYGDEGKWMALEMINQHYFSDRHYVSTDFDYLKKTISTFNFGLSTKRVGSVDEYVWKEIVVSLLNNDKDDKFALVISQQICDIFKSRDMKILDMYLSEISSILVTNYFELYWECVSKLLLDSAIARFNIRHVLGAKNGNFQFYDPIGVLFHNTDKYDIISDWCFRNQPKGPILIATMMPISELDEKGIVKWHNFALHMINKFCEVEGFLEEVSTNLQNFGFEGSTVPYYQMQVKLYELLLSDSNDKIKAWAENNIDTLNRIIKREELDDQEQYLEL